MSNPTLNILLKDYEMKKYNAEAKFEKDRNDFYTSHPELNDINNKLGELALNISKAVLNNDIELSDKLKKEFNLLKSQKDSFLKSIDVPARCFRAII